MKHVVIINGRPRTGKDTIVKLSSELCNLPVFNLSTIDCVRDIMKILDITETKTPQQRDQMSKLKEYLMKFDVPNIAISDSIDMIFADNDNALIYVHCREPHNIEQIKCMLNSNIITCTTLLVTRDTSNTVNSTASNDSDNNVENYQYDYTIDNNGEIDGTFGLRHKVTKFLGLLNIYL